jgi:hypothetical protein
MDISSKKGIFYENPYILQSSCFKGSALSIPVPLDPDISGA